MKKKYYDMGLRMQLCNTYGAKIKLSVVFYYNSYCIWDMNFEVSEQ